MSRGIVIIPGIDGSGHSHWQSIWASQEPESVTIQPDSWTEPLLEDWIQALDRAVALFALPPILVAHSLGCLLVAIWARTRPHAATGALLVAVPDPTGPNFPAQALSFADVPQVPLPFPAILVASVNDPYSPIGFAQRMASAWRASLVEAGALGHINEASALGAWPAGRALLDALRAQVARGDFQAGREGIP